jgi:hypothetical protein
MGHGRRLPYRSLAAALTALLICVALPASAGAFAHGMGLVVKSNATATPRAAAPRSLTPLPASADLTQYAVPVGDQGQVNSCAAWATDYTAFGYWERRLGIAGGRADGSDQ